MARECGFCRRERVINIYDFFKMLLHCANLQQCSSLSYMSSFLEIEHNTKVSKEAINKRFTENCVQFVEAVWGEVLKERYKDFLCSYGDNIFRSFNRVRIKDSTKFQLPDAMKADFPGTGGCASAAGVSIQFEYDIKSGTILYLKICPGTMNDHQDAADTCLDVERDDLIIRDLGYFSRDVLRVFVEKGAYFLSRLDSQTVVVEKKGRKRLNFDKLYKDMQKGGIIRKEITVLIGSSNQLEVRLIVELVPDCVYEQRLRNRRKQNHTNSRSKHRKSGSKSDLQIKDETKSRYRFNLHITNMNATLLPIDKVLPLYRIRWQVELIFKSWKSTSHVDKFQRMKKERFLCLLYAKLILIAINLQVIFRVQAAIQRKAEIQMEKESREKTGKRKGKGKEKRGEKIGFPLLSLNKAFKTLHRLFDLLMEILCSKRSSACQAEKIEQILSRNHQLERRKNKLSFPEILELFICKTEN